MSKKCTGDKLLSLLVAVGAVALMWQGVEACTQKSSPPPPPIWVKWHTHTHFVLPGQGADPDTIVWIWNGWARVHNYKTFGGSPGQFCACGLNFAGTGITSVDGIQIVAAGTEDAVPGFDAFVANTNTTGDLNTVSPGGTWTGFLAGVSGAVAPDIEVDLLFDITRRDSVVGGLVGNPPNVNDEVIASLQGGKIGTDEATAGGNLANTHLEIHDPGVVKYIPGAGIIALAVLALLLGVLGFLFLRRRQVAKAGI